MKTISGLFDTYEEARLTVYALEDAGIPGEDISLLAQEKIANETDNTVLAAGAGVGAAVGGVGGLLAGLVAFALPGIGQVSGVGWLATTLIGAAAGGLAGGLISSLIDAGIEEGDAHIYAEGIRRGSTLVTARVEDTELQMATAIMKLHHPVDTAARRREYEASGWAEFVPDDIWDSDIGNEDRT